MTMKEWLEQLDESEYRIYREGFTAAKEAARQIIESEIVNKYTDRRNPVSVLSQVSKSISELKPEVPQ